MVSKQAIEAGRAFVRLMLKDDMTRNLRRTLRSAGESMKSIGRTAMVVGGAMAAPFAFAARKFAEFDDAMRQVAGVTQAVDADFAKLTDTAKKLGASTSFTASQVALLMTELGRAGFVPTQIDAMTESVLALSRAANTEAALAAGIMSSAIRQFSLDAGDASRVADVLTAGANKSFNTLESLGEALKYAGPVANDFNMSLEDTVAIIGTLGNVGIQGSAAGTALRRLLVVTGADAEKLQNIFGVAFVDAEGNARPLVDTLQEVADATNEMGTAERARKFKDAFSLLGITGASAIARNISGTRELREEIRKAGGIAQKTAETMDAGLGGAFRKVLSATEGVQIAIGEELAPALTRFARILTSVAPRLIEWIKQNKELVVQIAKVGAGVVAAGAVFYVLGTTLGGVATTIKVVHGALMLLIAHPVIAGVAALAVVIYKLNDATAKLSHKQKQALATGDELRRQHQSQWQELQQLANKQSLATDEMDRAETIINKLEKSYGTLGVSVNKTSGEIEGMGEAQVRLNKAMTDAARAEATAALLEAQINLAELRREMKETAGYSPIKGLVGIAKAEVTGTGPLGMLDEAYEAQEKLQKQIRAARAIEVAAQSRLNAINIGVEGALTGGGATGADGGATGADGGATGADGGATGADGGATGADGGDDHAANAEDERLRREEQERRFLDRIKRLRLEAMEDEHARAIALIKHRYAIELRDSKAVGIAKQALQKAEGLEIENLNREYQRRKKQSDALDDDDMAMYRPNVGLTATYSAAAARISGFQVSGPEQKMADGIQKVEKNTLDMNRLLEEFLAGWRVA